MSFRSVLSRLTAHGNASLLHSIHKNAIPWRIPGPTSRYFSAQPGSKDHIDSLLKERKIVVFMKGTKEAPRCGFSNGVVQILNFHGVADFEAHDVLESDELRQGIKDYSNWPTIPQVYFDGEFIGGLDILLEMHKKGELIEELQKLGIRSSLLDAADGK